MATQPQKYLIAVMAHDHVKTYLDQLRRDYGIPVWGRGLDLHVTLVPPFTTHLSVGEIGERFIGIRYRTPRFTLELEGLARFDSARSALYIPVAPAPVLMRLQRGLNDALAGIAQPSEFGPHMTISDETTKERVDEYAARLAGEHIRLSMPCDRFSLLRKDDTWNVLCSFPIQP
jgi:2'-5' RNA ligase